MFAAQDILGIVSKAYTGLCGIRVSVSGSYPLPPGPKIVAINHTNVSDMILLPSLFSEMPVFMAQADMFQIPVLGRLLKELRQIPVDQAHPDESFKRACQVLAHNETVLIFPEGKLVPLGQRVKARTGAIRLSLATGAPLIPLGVYANPRDITKLWAFRRGKLREGLVQFRGKCHIRIGPAWKPHAGTTAHAQAEELLNRIYSLVQEAQAEELCGSPISLNPIIR